MKYRRLTYVSSSKLKKDKSLDGSRIVVGKVKYSIPQYFVRLMRYFLELPIAHVRGVYYTEDNIMIICSGDIKDEKEIAKIISHEFLHMLLRDLDIPPITLDDFLRKKNRYDLDKVDNGGI